GYGNFGELSEAVLNRYEMRIMKRLPVPNNWKRIETSLKESRSNTGVGYLITTRYVCLFEKLPVLEQLEKRLIVDVVMTDEFNLAESSSSSIGKQSGNEEQVGVIDICNIGTSERGQSCNGLGENERFSGEVCQCHLGSTTVGDGEELFGDDGERLEVVIVIDVTIIAS
ncbi:hypothetical protein L195_g035680, partial [Trifolium pratense]